MVLYEVNYTKGNRSILCASETTFRSSNVSLLLVLLEFTLQIYSVNLAWPFHYKNQEKWTLPVGIGKFNSSSLLHVPRPHTGI